MTAKKTRAKGGVRASAKAAQRTSNRSIGRPNGDIRDASTAKLRRIAAAFSRALKAEGLLGRVVRFEVEHDTILAKKSLAAGAAAGGACPPGQVLRLVCETRHGTTVCQERCVKE